MAGCLDPAPWLDEGINVFGTKKKDHAVAADKIVLESVPNPQLEGRGIVDELPPNDPAAKDGQVIHADGYRILLTAHTTVAYKQPLRGAADIAPNVWINYKGSLRSDGVLVAEDAAFSPNVIGKGEKKLDAKADKNAPPSATQRTDTTKVWLYSDPAMQARVDKIGESLVPQFERSIPSGDPTKIDFRFEVVDLKKWNSSGAQPNGVIPVPHEFVDRLQNDSQLAALLALDIASTIEHQGWRTKKEASTMGGATAAVVLLDPALVPLVAIYGMDLHEKNKLMLSEDDQNARVGLWLMHKAGYDIYQAPIAWWLLASKTPRPVADIPVPLQAEEIYKELGILWRDVPQTAAPPVTTAGNT
jgi:hypothetical protein